MGDDIDDTVIAPASAGPMTRDASAPDLDDTVLTHTRTALPPVAPVASVDTPASPTTGGYAVRLGLEGHPVPLDVPCLIGRNPRVPRVADGPVPRLLRVSSPAREVSATHLEVRQLGSTVIVTDLRSTNGSVVMVPGRTPRTLRQGESVVVSPGTLVDIGDNNILQVLSNQRLGIPPSGRQS